MVSGWTYWPGATSLWSTVPCTGLRTTERLSWICATWSPARARPSACKAPVWVASASATSLAAAIPRAKRLFPRSSCSRVSRSSASARRTSASAWRASSRRTEASISSTGSPAATSCPSSFSTLTTVPVTSAATCASVPSAGTTVPAASTSSRTVCPSTLAGRTSTTRSGLSAASVPDGRPLQAAQTIRARRASAPLGRTIGQLHAGLLLEICQRPVKVEQREGIAELDLPLAPQRVDQVQDSDGALPIAVPVQLADLSRRGDEGCDVQADLVVGGLDAGEGRRERCTEPLPEGLSLARQHLERGPRLGLLRTLSIEDRDREAEPELRTHGELGVVELRASARGQVRDPAGPRETEP